jgi:hypothetical protein
MKKAVLLLILAILPLTSQMPAQNLHDPEFMEQVEAGYTKIYNMDYSDAKQFFISLEAQYPSHPAPPIYFATVLLLEELLRRQELDLSRFVSPTYFSQKTNETMPPNNRTAFQNSLKKSESLINAILAKNRNDKDARYFLATIYGLRSSFAITIDHGLREAFSNGNKAYSQSKRLIEEDPSYYDAYLTIGLYEYIIGSIPWYLKWMAIIIGAHGNKVEGVEHMALASEKGRFNKNEAQLIEMVLFVRENRYPDALAIAKALDERYPRNFLFSLNMAQIYERAGQKDAAAAKFIQVLKRAETGAPNYNKLPLQRFRFNCAVELMNLGKWTLAQEQFAKSIDDPRTEEREKALSHLHLGQMLESGGQPNKAIQEYQWVLSLRDFEDSHSQAKRSLKKLRVTHREAAKSAKNL